MSLFEVVVGILIFQLLRGSTTRADNAKACFYGKFSKFHVFFLGGGHFCAFFAILGVLTLHFAFLINIMHFLIRKRHLLVYFMKISYNSPISGVDRTTVHNPRKCNLSGVCRKGTPHAMQML